MGTDEIVFRLAVRARGRVRPHEVALLLATVRLRAGRRVGSDGVDFGFGVVGVGVGAGGRVVAAVGVADGGGSAEPGHCGRVGEGFGDEEAVGEFGGGSIGLLWSRLDQ